MTTMMANRDPASLEGVALHVYAATKDMHGRVFVGADGELLFIPEQGRLEPLTELGRIELSPGQIALVPRGLRIRALLAAGCERGSVAENNGHIFRLPDTGPMSATGLSHPRHYETPTARF